jgi:hypothetical protein
MEMEMKAKAKRVRENEFHILKWKKKQMHTCIRPACSIVCHSSNQIKSNQNQNQNQNQKQKQKEKKRTNPSSILFK